MDANCTVFEQTHREIARVQCFTSRASVQVSTLLESPLGVSSPVQDDQLADTSSRKQDTKPFSADNIRQAEYDLYNLFSSPENQGSASASPPRIAQAWEILSRLIEDTPSRLTTDTHHLRKIAPYAPGVARLLENVKPSTVAQETLMDLARWCLLSSILFGAPPIPSKPTSDPRRSRGTRIGTENTTEGAFQGQVHDVPQSRWPSKSTRHIPHVFSPSKVERQEEVDQCQRPYLDLLRTGHEASATFNADILGKNIDYVLSALDASTRALSATTKASTRGQTLQSAAIHERAVGPVVDLLGIWLEAHVSVLRDSGDQLLDLVPEGLAAALRVVQRLGMQQLAVGLESRLRSASGRARGDHLADDECGRVVKKFLGACLLRNLNSLSFRLNRAAKGKDTEQITMLWESCSPLIRHLSDDDARARVLSLFLTVFVTAITNGNAGTQDFNNKLSEIYSLLPKPTPLPVYHALLSMYAGITTSPSDGNRESGHTTVSSQASLANLISTWSRMREEGVTPDIKAYSLLITGLGKKGDYQALQQAWEELIRDADCKALWQKEANQCE